MSKENPLVALRLKHGLTQKQLGKLSGTSQQRINILEANRGVKGTKNSPILLASSDLMDRIAGNLGTTGNLLRKRLLAFHGITDTSGALSRVSERRRPIGSSEALSPLFLLRAWKQWGQKELGDKCGQNQNVIHRIETGQEEYPLKVYNEIAAQFGPNVTGERLKNGIDRYFKDKQLQGKLTALGSIADSIDEDLFQTIQSACRVYGKQSADDPTRKQLGDIISQMWLAWSASQDKKKEVLRKEVESKTGVSVTRDKVKEPV